MRVLAALVSLMLAGSAAAEPFWVEYNASCGLFPEEVGWERFTYAGGAERWFEDGLLVLDGTASSDIADLSGMTLAWEPDPTEFFRMEWRLRVDEVYGFADPLVAVECGGHGTVFLRYAREAVYSLFEGVWIPFAPGEFHEYALTSHDMLTYKLEIDGVLAHVGEFVGPWYHSAVGWGDGTSGASSVARWEYVRFGVVPEPTGRIQLAVASFVLWLAAAKRIGRDLS